MTSDQGGNLIAPRIGQGDGHERGGPGKEDREKQEAVGQIGEVSVDANIRGVCVAWIEGHGAAFVGFTSPQDEATLRYSQDAVRALMIDDKNRQLGE